MNIVFAVVSPSLEPSLNMGTVLGYVYYNTTCDMMSACVYLDKKITTPIGQYGCSCEGGNYINVILYKEEIREDATLCKLCNCLVFEDSVS